MLCRREWRRPGGRPMTNSAMPRVAADSLAGMTDRFALDEHHRSVRHFGPDVIVRFHL